MKLGVVIAANSVTVSLNLGRCSSFRFCLVSVLLLRFVPPFKCTGEKNLQTLITPHSKVLCN